ncbi:hypothetical protein B0H14DRAFT_2770029 [Mycena olivaceomarginata]|nr:hypothetical protein B0H14DRAFT_2770029 [Mycena olivaceomarginata]
MELAESHSHSFRYSSTVIQSRCTRVQLGVASWFAAQKELRETHGYQGVTQATQDELGLLKGRSHQVKGDIKTIVREVADRKKGYGFKDGKSPEDIAYNRRLVTALLTGNAFLFKVPPALQEILNRAFYNDENNSEAIRAPSYFANGAPLTLLAVFANAERATGELVKCRMSAKTWQPKYEKHLKILEDWKVYTTNSGSHLTQKLQIRMIQDARRYARVDEAGISTADFAKNDA